MGWAQLPNGASVYRLDYIRRIIKDLRSNIESKLEGFVKLERWRAY